MLWRGVVACLVVTIVFALWAAAFLFGAADVGMMHVSSIDWRAWNLMLVHLTWMRRSWIESAVQLLQQVTYNALVGGGVAFGCGDCVCFAGSSLTFVCGRCGDDVCFFALIGGLGIPCWFI